ncbi:MAG: prepilin-type N-terminal cleavage/methylation domain-containing protein [Candidatus Saccharimonadales bacterium]
MSRRNIPQLGFTLVELMITISVSAIVASGMYVFFNTSFNQYLALQSNSSQFTDLAAQSQRLANVLRGLTDIITPGSNDLTVYAYFAPNNTYVSVIRYYLVNNGKTLMADVTPMSADPPIGSPITAKKRTFTIIGGFSNAPGVNLFNYLDSSGAIIPMPLVDQHIVKGIQINLSVPTSSGGPNGNQAMSLNVSLRNRKTNL